MRFLYILLASLVLANADDLDFLDEIDSDTSSFIEDKNSLNARAKLSFLKNENRDDTITLFVSAREQDGHYFYDVRVLADEDVQSFNIKELYYKGEFLPTSFYEVGRINIKEGVARGYNPTDYFKGTTSLTLSNDPKERKDNRLGALLVSNTLFLDKFTIKGIYSPKITSSKDTLWSDSEHFGLHLDETNYDDRASLYVGYSGWTDVSSSMVLHYNEDDLNLGLNLSYISGSWIFYLENSLKKSKDNVSKIIDNMSAHPQIKQRFSKSKSYIDEAVAGVNYTSESNIVTSLEYIYNSEGLDSGDWDDWFELSRNGANMGKTLGLIREKNTQNESMMSRDSIFIFSRVSDIVTNLDALALAWINPYDGSFASEVGVEYSYDDNFQANFYLRNYTGSSQSEYGSSLDDYQLLIEGEYFF